MTTGTAGTAFARTATQQWLDSPGHRANLLDPNLECLGCSARWRKDYSGLDLPYPVQVFATPGQPPEPR